MLTIDPTPGTEPYDTKLYVDCCAKISEIPPRLVRNPKSVLLGKETDNSQRTIKGR